MRLITNQELVVRRDGLLNTKSRLIVQIQRALAKSNIVKENVKVVVIKMNLLIHFQKMKDNTISTR